MTEFVGTGNVGNPFENYLTGQDLQIAADMIQLSGAMRNLCPPDVNTVHGLAMWRKPLDGKPRPAVIIAGGTACGEDATRYNLSVVYGFPDKMHDADRRSLGWMSLRGLTHPAHVSLTRRLSGPGGLGLTITQDTIASFLSLDLDRVQTFDPVTHRVVVDKAGQPKIEPRPFRQHVERKLAEWAAKLPKH